MGKVLVTGAKGFVGRNIVKVLKETNEIIECGRNRSEQTNEHLFVQWDISDGCEPDDLSGKSIDTIVHAAASLETDNLSNELIKVNCEGTLNVLRFAVSHGVRTIVYISSLPIVGNSHQIPITEDVVNSPQTLYHATKAAGEMIISQAVHYGIRTASLRVPSPIGPDMPKKTIVPIFVQRALYNEDIQIQGMGTRKQSYLDVRDLAAAVERIIENNKAEGVYNMGSRNVLSNNELAAICVQVLNSKSRIVLSGDDPNDLADWTTDDSRLREIIGEYQILSIRQTILDIAEEIRRS